ncbi:DUF3592 domain-containing protein [Corallococcus sp. CA054B]|uniref:DUF3592 domain-containing protein n=1 Tax=Corallococcus sp. CA054B TaxID=2316734 RepID=UPI000EA0FB7B|nr:DUF3592 domain-containing protein [Corallococcus sp. CA054B]RKG71055.1 DUF3592 domain-containing protein [Corallococcus sp. CA054B]
MPLNAIVVGVFLVGSVLVVLVRLLLQHQLTLELRERGLHARGEVVSVRTSWMNGRQRIVEYVFYLEDGAEVRGKYSENSSSLFSSAPSEGDPLEVHYLPDNPYRHQRVGTEVGLLGAATGVIGMAVLLVLLVLMLMSAPRKKAPAPRGPTPAGTLRNYDETPSRTRPHPSGEKRQLGAY